MAHSHRQRWSARVTTITRSCHCWPPSTSAASTLSSLLLYGFPAIPMSLSMSLSAVFLVIRSGVGVDVTSLDVLLLTDSEFQGKNGWEKVPVTGTQVPRLLQEGLFDAINLGSPHGLRNEMIASKLYYG